MDIYRNLSSRIALEKAKTLHTKQDVITCHIYLYRRTNTRNNNRITSQWATTQPKYGAIEKPDQRDAKYCTFLYPSNLKFRIFARKIHDTYYISIHIHICIHIYLHICGNFRTVTYIHHQLTRVPPDIYCAVSTNWEKRRAAALSCAFNINIRRLTPAAREGQVRVHIVQHQE